MQTSCYLPTPKAYSAVYQASCSNPMYWISRAWPRVRPLPSCGHGVLATPSHAPQVGVDEDVHCCVIEVRKRSEHAGSCMHDAHSGEERICKPTTL